MERRTVRNILVIGGLLFAAFFVWKAVIGMAGFLLMTVFKVVLPIAIVAGIGYWAYRKLFSDRSLSDSGHRRLPRL